MKTINAKVIKKKIINKKLYKEGDIYQIETLPPLIENSSLYKLES